MYGDQFGEFVCGFCGLTVKGDEEINSDSLGPRKKVTQPLNRG